MIKIKFFFFLFFIKLVLSEFFECQFGDKKNYDDIEFENIFRLNNDLIVVAFDKMYRTRMPLLFETRSRLLFANTQPLIIDANRFIDTSNSTRVSYYIDGEDVYYVLPDHYGRLYYTEDNGIFPIELHEFSPYLEKHYNRIRNFLNELTFTYFVDDQIFYYTSYCYIYYNTFHGLKVKHDWKQEGGLEANDKYYGEVRNVIYYIHDFYRWRFRHNILIELKDSKSIHIDVLRKDHFYQLRKIHFEEFFLCSNIIKEKKNIKGIFYKDGFFYTFFDFYYLRLKETILDSGFHISLDLYGKKRKLIFDDIDQKDIYYENKETVWIRYIKGFHYLYLPFTISWFDFKEKEKYPKLKYWKSKDLDYDCIRNFITINERDYCFEEKTYYDIKDNKPFEIKNVFVNEYQFYLEDNDDLILFFDYKFNKSYIFMTTTKVIVIEKVAIKTNKDNSLTFDLTSSKNYKLIKNCIFFNTCEITPGITTENYHDDEEDEIITENPNKNQKKKEKKKLVFEEKRIPFYKTPLFVLGLFLCIIIFSSLTFIFYMKMKQLKKLRLSKKSKSISRSKSQKKKPKVSTMVK